MRLSVRTRESWARYPILDKLSRREQVGGAYKALHISYRPRILSWLRTKAAPAWFKSVLNYFLKQSLLQQSNSCCLPGPNSVSGSALCSVCAKKVAKHRQPRDSPALWSLASKRTAAFIKQCLQISSTVTQFKRLRSSRTAVLPVLKRIYWFSEPLAFLPQGSCNLSSTRNCLHYRTRQFKPAKNSFVTISLC